MESEDKKTVSSLTPSPIKACAEQKWEFYIGSMIARRLVPRGWIKVKGIADNVSNLGPLTQKIVENTAMEAVAIHKQFKKELQAKIQLLIAKERSGLWTPTQKGKVDKLQECFDLVDELAPSNVGELPQLGIPPAQSPGETL